jgi:hypothetical protein
VNHYIVNVPVSDEHVAVIKALLEDYTTLSEGFIIQLIPMNETAPPPEQELTDAIVQVFMQLLARLVRGKFEGIN